MLDGAVWSGLAKWCSLIVLDLWEALNILTMLLKLIKSWKNLFATRGNTQFKKLRKRLTKYLALNLDNGTVRAILHTYFASFKTRVKTQNLRYLYSTTNSNGQNQFSFWTKRWRKMKNWWQGAQSLNKRFWEQKSIQDWLSYCSGLEWRSQRQIF